MTHRSTVTVSVTFVERFRLGVSGHRFDQDVLIEESKSNTEKANLKGARHKRGTRICRVKVRGEE